MSRHEKLRENKCCENCGHYVEKRFCTECGQENVETRQSFHYLFTVSIEDLIHYDSRFWKTILYLLFYPAKLTKIYLAGKRKLYVPPVTLYIFISFITFFVPEILPDKNGGKTEILKGASTSAQEDLKELEEMSARLKENYNQEDLEKLQKKAAEVGEKHKNENNKVNINGKEFDEKKLEEKIIHDFPKAIFLYMPIFAFWLWLFHSKKKWYYFDHGIYTLHYFSFILLSILLFILLRWNYSFFGLGEIKLIKTIAAFSSIAMFIYLIYYFFHSHRIIYQETKTISRLKCILLFFINTFCMLLFLTSYVIIEAYFLDKTIFTEIVNQIKSAN